MQALEAISEQIRHYDAEIKRVGQRQIPAIELFRQVYGVGPLVGLAFAAVIENPRRFSRSRDVGPYIGLTPRIYQSGESNPRLRISKQGDSTLRSLLVTAATHILRRSAPDSDLKRYGRRIAKSGTPRDRARAHIAVARKLAVVLHRIWLTGEVYQPLYRSEQPV